MAILDISRAYTSFIYAEHGKYRSEFCISLRDIFITYNIRVVVNLTKTLYNETVYLFF